MIRSPHRTLAQFDASTGVLDRAVQPLNLGPHRLERAEMKTKRQELATLLKFATQPGSTGLAVRVPTSRRALAEIGPTRVRVRTVTTVPTLSREKRFPVASLDLIRKDITLPFGIGRYVNAATLKAIAGGRLFDRLLKRTSSGWEFVPDNTRIDLSNDRQEFRLGALTIFS